MIPEDMANDCTGYCRHCGEFHALPQGQARTVATRLRKDLEQKKSIALFANSPRPHPLLATEYLFGTARGKMFGVLECLAADGSSSWLYAFSGQYNGEWLAEGWVPPLFDVAAFHRIQDPVESQIKALGREIATLAMGTEHRRIIQNKRRQLSRTLMQKLHALYRVNNFRGTTASLDNAVGNLCGKPTGTGDCCAPKLLNFAASSGLAPISLAEFYFGRDNRSQSRCHGHFYPPCKEKCGPLLGFMLCGSRERRQQYAK